MLRHKWISLGVALGVTALAFVATSGLRSEFIAPQDKGQFAVDLQLPDSASFELATTRAAEAETALRKIPEVRDVYAIVGPDGEANKVKMRVLSGPKQERKRSVQQLKDEARALLRTLPATRVFVSDPPDVEGLGDFFPVMVRLIGPDMSVLNREGARVAEIIRGLPGTIDVKIESSPPKPELTVKLDRTRAANLGLSATDIATQLRLAVDGIVPAKLREGKDETDIRVRLREADRGSVSGSIRWTSSPCAACASWPTSPRSGSRTGRR